MGMTNWQKWKMVRPEFLPRFISSTQLFMKSDIIVWNCQGAASVNFHKVLKEYFREFNPNLVVLVETKVSSIQGNRVIQSIG